MSNDNDYRQEKLRLPNTRDTRGDALRSPSYFAGNSGGAPIEMIRHYIKQQQTPH